MFQSRDFPDTRASLLSVLGGSGTTDTAWREFFWLYAPAVYRVARCHQLDTYDADDVVQQVMMSVAAHIGDFSYQRDRSRFRSWITTITRNKVRDLGRRKKTAYAAQNQILFDECHDLACDSPDFASLWEQEWQKQDMLWCLQQIRADLAPRKFKAFSLYVLNGVSAEETAKQVGMSIGHVYVTRTEIVKRLRSMARELENRSDDKSNGAQEPTP
ncbi:MAG: sigma-70 family RNA polymerase sigma factor [Phycisphaerales bacterium]|nr:sigma-70 family RNA polymerase sigma factor [Phycisphaerales bacterium]